MNSEVTHSPFPDRLAVLPSERYVFEQSGSDKKLSFRIVHRGRLSNGIRILATNVEHCSHSTLATAISGSLHGWPSTGAERFRRK